MKLKEAASSWAVGLNTLHPKRFLLGSEQYVFILLCFWTVRFGGNNTERLRENTRERCYVFPSFSLLLLPHPPLPFSLFIPSLTCSAMYLAPLPRAGHSAGPEHTVMAQRGIGFDISENRHYTMHAVTQWFSCRRGTCLFGGGGMGLPSWLSSKEFRCPLSITTADVSRALPHVKPCASHFACAVLSNPYDIYVAILILIL